MHLVLDTNSLWHATLTEALSIARRTEVFSPPGRSVVLPAVAYVERARQVHGDPPREAAWETILRRVQPTIEAFSTQDAHRLVGRAPSTASWHAHARDYLIAAHVHGERVGVTRDGGPAWEGLPTITPDQAAELVQAMSGG